MRKLVLLLFLVFCVSLVSCGDRTKTIVSKDGKDGSGCVTETVSSGVRVVCNGETTLIENGQAGVNGTDGQNGTDAVVLTKSTVKKNSCSKIDTGLYVENIRDGIVFDVYMDSSCSDRVGGVLNEYCDNVQTQYGNVGSLGQGEAGSATVCWVGLKQLSGVRLSNGDIEIRILDFN